MKKKKSQMPPSSYKRRRFGRSSIGDTIFKIVVLAVGGGLAWYGYDWFSKQGIPVVVPEVEEEEVQIETPEKKERPERPKKTVKKEEPVVPDEPKPEEPKKPTLKKAQLGVPPPLSAAQTRSLGKAADALARKYEIEEERRKGKPTFVQASYSAAQWTKPQNIQKDVLERVMSYAEDTDKMFNILADSEKRLDIARATLLRKAGCEALAEIAKLPSGADMLAAISSDLDWISGVLYSGPTQNLEIGLQYLAGLYHLQHQDMSDPIVRRIATTAALEYAREGRSAEDLEKRFGYYYSSYKEGKLNVVFNDLRYWDTRIVTGCKADETWGGVESLTWQRDNVRLPAAGYLDACTQLQYRLRNAAGDSIFSNEYMAPVNSYLNGRTALGHREVGGVCGACSHYGAFGALAAGIPAMTMGEPGHCAYTVRVGNTWHKSYSIYWKHGMHKTFWGLHDWDFLILMQDLYGNYHKTMVADQLLAVAELLADAGYERAAFHSYDAAIGAQPLNWEAWLSYAAYLEKQAPEHKARWQEMHDKAVDTMGAKFHNAAATLLVKKVYPRLLPLIPAARDRNKLFRSFFDQCKTFGTNRWDLDPLLNAQLDGCKTTKEKFAYMRDALRILMSRKDYAGAVLTWGLEYMGSLPADDPDSEKIQKEFNSMIMRSLSRVKSGKKGDDPLKGALGEAIHSAAQNGDKRTFQAVGKLAYKRYKKDFPKKKLKVRGFSGVIVSSKGLIRSATTIDPGPDCCMHWAVLQPFGGSIPAKFENKAGTVVELDGPSQLTGVYVAFEGEIKNDRDFKLEVSDNGQNWEFVQSEVEVDGDVLRVDLKKEKPEARFVRLLREGDKWESGMSAFFVYGKVVRDRN